MLKQRRRREEKVWRLFRRKLSQWHMQYAWVDPDGIVRHERQITQLGFLPFQMEEITGMPAAAVLLKEREWKPFNTAMTQEHLAQGWLLTNFFNRRKRVH